MRQTIKVAVSAAASISTGCKPENSCHPGRCFLSSDPGSGLALQENLDVTSAREFFSCGHSRLSLPTSGLHILAFSHRFSKVNSQDGEYGGGKATNGNGENFIGLKLVKMIKFSTETKCHTGHEICPHLGVQNEVPCDVLSDFKEIASDNGDSRRKPRKGF